MIGHYTYRLKQIDHDGSFAFSNEMDVDVKGPNQIELNQNYPNPFNPSTTILYKVSKPGII